MDQKVSYDSSMLRACPFVCASMLLCGGLQGCAEQVVHLGDVVVPWSTVGTATTWEEYWTYSTSSGWTLEPQGPPVDMTESGVIQCMEPDARSTQGPYTRHFAGSPANEMTWHGSGGVLSGDFNQDGFLDLVTPAEPYAKLYLGNASGTFVEDLVLLDFRLTNGIGGSVADFDGDEDLDIYLLRLFERNVLLENQGDATFIDVTDEAFPRLPDADLAPSMTSTWGDIDGDGDLDLFVGNYGEPEVDLWSTEPAWPSVLYLNEGDGSFSDASHWLPPDILDGYTYMAGFHDVNGDLKLDLYVVNDLGWLWPNQLLLNTGDGFVEDNNQRGLNLSLSAAGLGVGDLNGDGLPDFLMPEWNQVRLLESSTFGPWIDQANARGIMPDSDRKQQTGWGAELADMDNDGDLDAAIAYGHIGFVDPIRANSVRQPDALFLQEEGVFKDTAPEWGIDDDGSNRGFVLVDANDDGFLDIVKRDAQGPSVLHLSRCDESAWLRVSLRAPSPNTHAVGAQVWLESEGQLQTRTVHAGGTSYGSGGPPEVHFGLGEHEVVERLTIVWPDGQTSDFQDVDARQALRIRRYR